MLLLIPSPLRDDQGVGPCHHTAPEGNSNSISSTLASRLGSGPLPALLRGRASVACPPLPKELSFSVVRCLLVRGAPLTNSKARLITAVDQQGLGPPDGLPTGGAAAEGLWEGRAAGRDGLWVPTCGPSWPRIPPVKRDGGPRMSRWWLVLRYRVHDWWILD